MQVGVPRATEIIKPQLVIHHKEDVQRVTYSSEFAAELRPLSLTNMSRWTEVQGMCQSITVKQDYGRAAKYIFYARFATVKMLYLFALLSQRLICHR